VDDVPGRGQLRAIRHGELGLVGVDALNTKLDQLGEGRVFNEPREQLGAG
jgi:hypothetical protein